MTPETGLTFSRVSFAIIFETVSQAGEAGQRSEGLFNRFLG